MTFDLDLLRGMAPAARDELLAIAQHPHFEPGENLFHQGDPASALILIVEGKVKIWRSAPGGSALTLTVVGAGEPIGTLHAAGDMPHTATATALVPTETVAWPIDQIRRIMRDDAALTANVLGVVARYAVLMIERLEEVSTVPVEQRVALALCRAVHGAWGTDGETDIPLSRQDIADMSSTTLPTVSRIMSRWRAAGLIGGHRGRVRILDQPALRAIAGWPA